jgi:transcription elongation factor GreA
MPEANEQLTPEQHTRLTAELAELEGPKRAEIVEAIAVARGHGDLSENFEYHAAKNEQGLLERRIAILRARLDGAVVVEAGPGDVVAVGSRVVVDDGTGERLELEISSVGGEGTVSPSSPLGAALVGRRAGETVDVEAPRGTWKATIMEIRGS